MMAALSAEKVPCGPDRKEDHSLRPTSENDYQKEEETPKSEYSDFPMNTAERYKMQQARPSWNRYYRVVLRDGVRYRVRPEIDAIAAGSQGIPFGKIIETCKPTPKDFVEIQQFQRAEQEDRSWAGRQRTNSHGWVRVQPTGLWLPTHVYGTVVLEAMEIQHGQKAHGQKAPPPTRLPPFGKPPRRINSILDAAQGLLTVGSTAENSSKATGRYDEYSEAQEEVDIRYYSPSTSRTNTQSGHIQNKKQNKSHKEESNGSASILETASGSKAKRPRTYNSKYITGKRPKQPKTAYNFYQLAVRGQISAELREEMQESVAQRGGRMLSQERLNQDVMRLIGKRWRSLVPEERQRYQAMADEDSRRYHAELEAQETAFREAGIAFPPPSRSPHLSPFQSGQQKKSAIRVRRSPAVTVHNPNRPITPTPMSLSDSEMASDKRSGRRRTLNRPPALTAERSWRSSRDMEGERRASLGESIIGTSQTRYKIGVPENNDDEESLHPSDESSSSRPLPKPEPEGANTEATSSSSRSLRPRIAARKKDMYYPGDDFIVETDRRRPAKRNRRTTSGRQTSQGRSTSATRNGVSTAEPQRKKESKGSGRNRRGRTDTLLPCPKCNANDRSIRNGWSRMQAPRNRERKRLYEGAAGKDGRVQRFRCRRCNLDYRAVAPPGAPAPPPGTPMTFSITLSQMMAGKKSKKPRAKAGAGPRASSATPKRPGASKVAKMPTLKTPANKPVKGTKAKATRSAPARAEISRRKRPRTLPEEKKQDPVKKTENKVSWRCTVCTLENNGEKLMCPACGCKKPRTNQKSPISASPILSTQKKRWRAALEVKEEGTNSESEDKSVRKSPRKTVAKEEPIEKMTNSRNTSKSEKDINLNDSKIKTNQKPFTRRSRSTEIVSISASGRPSRRRGSDPGYEEGQRVQVKWCSTWYNVILDGPILSRKGYYSATVQNCRMDFHFSKIRLPTANFVVGSVAEREEPPPIVTASDLYRERAAERQKEKERQKKLEARRRRELEIQREKERKEREEREEKERLKREQEEKERQEREQLEREREEKERKEEEKRVKEQEKREREQKVKSERKRKRRRSRLALLPMPTHAPSSRHRGTDPGYESGQPVQVKWCSTWYYAYLDGPIEGRRGYYSAMVQNSRMDFHFSKIRLPGNKFKEGAVACREEPESILNANNIYLERRSRSGRVRSRTEESKLSDSDSEEAEDSEKKGVSSPSDPDNENEAPVKLDDDDDGEKEAAVNLPQDKDSMENQNFDGVADTTTDASKTESVEATVVGSASPEEGISKEKVVEQADISTNEGSVLAPKV